jgi:branched-chain amino acid aminotransferase
MIVFLNGQFVPEAQATVSIFDRSFLYGDGLFETIRIFRGQPFRWTEHMKRLEHGAAFLNIKIPFPPAELLHHVTELITRNQLPEALLRITLSRGVGPRGYSPKGANTPTIAMSLHPAPDAHNQPKAWHVIIAASHLPANEPFAEFKTCNKLAQILARAQADAIGADEALLLNTKGEVVEGSSSNLFWIQQDTVCTPRLRSGILAGVTRLVVLEICRQLNLPAKEATITPAELRHVQGAFLSLSSWGIVEIDQLDRQPFPRSPLTLKLSAAYDKMVASLAP